MRFPSPAQRPKRTRPERNMMKPHDRVAYAFLQSVHKL